MIHPEADRDECVAYIGELEAENARLQAHAISMIDEMKAESERLQQLYTVARDQCGMLYDENRRLQDLLVTVVEQRDRYAAEIERQTSALLHRRGNLGRKP